MTKKPGLNLKFRFTEAEREERDARHRAAALLLQQEREAIELANRSPRAKFLADCEAPRSLDPLPNLDFSVQPALLALVGLQQREENPDTEDLYGFSESLDYTPDPSETWTPQLPSRAGHLA